MVISAGLSPAAVPLYGYRRRGRMGGRQKGGNETAEGRSRYGKVGGQHIQMEALDGGGDTKSARAREKGVRQKR